MNENIVSFTLWAIDLLRITLRLGSLDHEVTQRETYTVQNSIETKASPAIAIPNSIVGYGRAAVISVEPHIKKESQKESLSDKFSFYYGEYVTGILFVVALSLYTVLMPEGISNPLKQVFDMIDRLLKKILDYAGALLGLVLASPLFLIIPILIKLDSRGPVFYTQDRVGVDRRKKSRRLYDAEIDGSHRIRERRRDNYNGRVFRVIKFRTMVQNAESKTGAVWATKNDARITALGKFMRKTRIDEVPQLLNVLAGDMSMVGPRPERPVFVQDFTEKIPNYAKRLTVKPGITGLAQVSSGYDTSLDSVIGKLKYDTDYIRGWSIWKDVSILLKTVVVVITGKGAC